MAPKATASKEDKVLAREQVRECKALAVQAARKQKVQLSIANRFLNKVVKAQFNVSSMVNGKFAKRLGEHVRAQGNGVKTALAAMEKNLRMALFGKNETQLDDKEFNKLLTDAKTRHESALQLVAASAATL